MFETKRKRENCSFKKGYMPENGERKSSKQVRQTAKKGGMSTNYMKSYWTTMLHTRG